MTIVKSLVEIHGGQVRAHSDGPGKGATFEVRLPLARAGKANVPGDPALSAPATVQTKVLIVDDNVDAAESMAEMLRLEGFEVRAAIDYYYTSRLPGEPAAGVNDVHFHPIESRSFRVSTVINF